MKLKTLIIGSALAFFALNSCTSEPTEEVETTETETTPEVEAEPVVEASSYSINTDSSEVTWMGGKVFSDDSHNGTIAIKSGSAIVEGDELVGGEIVIDMTQITVLDNTNKEKLVGHLSNGDFFEVETYPEAKFVITSVTEGEITGDLSIKDSTHSATVPATITVEEGSVSIEGTLVFDRTKFGVEFGSSTALGAFDKLAGDLKNKAIKDEIEIGLNIIATK